MLSVYFTYLYLKGEKNYYLLGVPILIFVTTLFMYYASSYAQTQGLELVGRDYTVFSLMAGIFLLMYTLSVHKIVKLDTTVAIALFASTLILHMIPAYASLIANLDSYWQYKWAEVAYDTGFVPDHDYLTYPLTHGMDKHMGEAPGLDISRASFFVPVFLAYTASVTKAVNIGIYDVSILYPGVIPAITVLVLYLLVSELFSEHAPYNKIAAFLAAFVLMISPGYATNATAGNPEDDAFGMFLVLTSFLFFVYSFKRRDMDYVYLAGLSFFMLRTAWGGYIYSLIILGAFSVVYSIARFLKNEPCFDHVTYVFASVVPSFLTPIILHPRGGLPHLPDFLPYNVNIVALAGALFVGIFLEYVRHARSPKEQDAAPGNVLDRFNAWVQGNPKVVFSIVIVLVVAGLMLSGFGEIWGVVKSTLESRKQDDVIKKTIAEQHPFASSLGEYLTAGSNRFSVLFLYAFIMIPVLLYVALKRADFGSLFVLSWSIPMLYGVYFKSQYIFNASVPITVLGATIGLYSIARKEDFASLRIVGAILILVVPFISVPFGGVKYYSQAIAMIPMHMSPGGDIYYWEPALEWLESNTRPNEGVLTWWDYGHWITAVSHRPVLIDNLQADPYEIQDVARFFVNATTEENAMRIFRAYERRYREVTEVFPEGVDLRYIAIDWTMIGKGSALHFIATGNIDTKADGDFKNYVTCGFYPQASDKTQRVMSDENGTMFLGRRIVFACGGYIPGVEFLVKEDNEIVGINVILNYGQKVPWKTWVEHNDASLLGVEPLFQILSLAISRPDDNILPQYRSLVYVPEEFSDFMMTRLYLSDTIDAVYDERACANEANKKSLGCTSYLSAGLYNRQYEPLKNFRLVKDFSSGFVRVYEKVAAPEDATSPP